LHYLLIKLAARNSSIKKIKRLRNQKSYSKFHTKIPADAILLTGIHLIAYNLKHLQRNQTNLYEIQRNHSEAQSIEELTIFQKIILSGIPNV
jgi:hypothetical protein